MLTFRPASPKDKTVRERVPEPILFLDVSGRFAKTTPLPIVVAAIAVPHSKVEELRHAVLAITTGLTVKWSEAHKASSTAIRLFRCIGKRQLTLAVTIVRKHEPEWTNYWESGDRLVQALRHFPFAENPTYAGASVALKYQIYNHGIAQAYGNYLRHHGVQFRKWEDYRKIRVRAVCDSDIQGEKNIKMFREILDKVDDLPQTRQATGILPKFITEVMTEQEEPLLTLPDHVAGYIYSQKVFGDGDDNSRAPLLRQVEMELRRWPPGMLEISEWDFDSAFPIPIAHFEASAEYAQTPEGRKHIAEVRRKKRMAESGAS